MYAKRTAEATASLDGGYLKGLASRMRGIYPDMIAISVALALLQSNGTGNELGTPTALASGPKDTCLSN